MEILKNFFAGLIVILLAFFLFIASMILWPIIIVVGSVLLISFKLILFIAVFVCFILLIGYIVRKGFKG